MGKGRHEYIKIIFHGEGKAIKAVKPQIPDPFLLNGAHGVNVAELTPNFDADYNRRAPRKA